MNRPLLLVTGFGPFEDVQENPSELVARGLEAAPPEGVDVVSEVLPVSFARAPADFDQALSRVHPRVPDFLLGLGVHREDGYRVELRARAALTKRGRPDVDGVSAFQADTAPGPDLRTGVEDSLRAFVDAENEFYLSEEAGGYVCERLYRAQLERGKAILRPALFVHVPHLEHASVDRQVADLGQMLLSLL